MHYLMSLLKTAKTAKTRFTVSPEEKELVIAYLQGDITFSQARIAHTKHRGIQANGTGIYTLIARTAKQLVTEGILLVE